MPANLWRDLVERPTCSFVVGWGGEQTVQFEGVAIEPEGTELERVQEEYCAVWPRAHFVARHSILRFTAPLTSIK